MNEKQEFLNLIQNISDQFHNGDISDYQTVLYLLRTLLKNKEQDEDILNEAQYLIEKILLQEHQEECCCEQPPMINEFEQAYRSIYAKNGISLNDIRREEQAYEELHRQGLDIISFRLFSPYNRDFNYILRLD